MARMTGRRTPRSLRGRAQSGYWTKRQGEVQVFLDEAMNAASDCDFQGALHAMSKAGVLLGKTKTPELKAPIARQIGVYTERIADKFRQCDRGPANW